MNVSWPACKPCPEFSNCDGGWKTPRPEAGFWRTPLCTSRTQCVNAFLKCKPNVACPGLDSNECLEGYTGRICGQCAEGYYKRNQYCRKCPVGSEKTAFKEQMDPFTNIVFAGLSYLLTLVIQVVFSRNRKDMSKSMLQTRTIVVIIYSVVMVIGLASIFSRIQVNFHGLFTYQILAVCLVLFLFYNFTRYMAKVGVIFILSSFLQLFFVFSRYEIPWMTLHKLVYDVIGDTFLPLTLYPSFVESMALECYSAENIKFRDLYSVYTLGIAIELGIVSVIFLASLLVTPLWRFIFSKLKWKIYTSFTNSIYIETSKLLNAQVVILELGLIFVLNSNTGLFTCSSQPDGTFTIDALPSEPCIYDAHTQSGQLYVTTYVLGVLFLLLMSVDKNSRLAVIGKRFRSGAKPWHLIVLMRTLTVVFIASFLDKSFEGIPFKTLPVIQCGMTMMMILINLCLHLVFEPYKDSIANSIEVFFLGSTFLTIFCGLLFKTGDFPDPRINEFFDLTGAVLIILVSLYAVFQITIAVIHRLEFEEAKVKSAIMHGGSWMNAVHACSENLEGQPSQRQNGRRR